MKIYKYGNDYAFQREQKSKESIQVLNAVEPAVTESTEKTKGHVEDKVQAGGNGSVADAAQSDTPKQPSKTGKKKKENDSKAEQAQEASQVQ